MNDKPLVSILIPCFNNEEFVGEAIESALSQTYSNIEVVVVDDGSTDRSLDVMRSFEKKIKWLSGPNRGACIARNAALELSQGEFIQFLDADDLLVSTKIEKQLQKIISGDFDLVLCKGSLFGDGRPERPIKKPVPYPEQSDPVWYFLNFPSGTNAPLFRRTIIEKVGGFRPNIPRAQEWDLQVRLASAGARLGLVDEILCRIRNHSSESRLTKRKISDDYNLKLSLEINDIIKDPPYSLSVKGKSAWASHLVQCSIYAYRNGFKEIAKRGFKESKKWCAQPQVDERYFYRLLARFFPLSYIELSLDVCRKARDKFQSMKKL
jgi:glycosyltransferase involved in cell wall biosynthesis